MQSSTLYCVSDRHQPRGVLGSTLWCITLAQKSLVQNELTETFPRCVGNKSSPLCTSMETAIATEFWAGRGCNRVCLCKFVSVGSCHFTNCTPLLLPTSEAWPVPEKCQQALWYLNSVFIHTNTPLFLILLFLQLFCAQPHCQPCPLPPTLPAWSEHPSP